MSDIQLQKPNKAKDKPERVIINSISLINILVSIRTYIILNKYIGIRFTY